MTGTGYERDVGGPSGDQWREVQAGPEFSELRRRLRVFVFPLTAFFLAWYLLYVLLAVYAPGFMAAPVAGNINVGIVFGLLQFVTTFVITGLYASYANRRLDPIADRLRGRIEGTSAEAATEGEGEDR
ncbi:DUF485 domain-containing protein [Nocardiopsis sp. RSe5-2]|uniref:DUF485 domain-containing protein n=1 Tax=Nocardiopsis endophytica TaxID=3018445 RepID=A0ABT4UEY9_9ACTN|nr:DUF485 domain-containing protein [Nocardiopsis endophytica]MDA2814925.1 DUF485 domain-containing protein [Nocardiopsis endophytica]